MNKGGLGQQDKIKVLHEIRVSCIEISVSFVIETFLKWLNAPVILRSILQ